jgi:hypothetical protein
MYMYPLLARNTGNHLEFSRREGDESIMLFAQKVDLQCTHMFASSQHTRRAVIYFQTWELLSEYLLLVPQHIMKNMFFDSPFTVSHKSSYLFKNCVLAS